MDTTNDAASIMASFGAIPSDEANLLIRAEPGALVTQKVEHRRKICTTGKA